MPGVTDKSLIRLGPWPAGIANVPAEQDLPRSEDGRRVIAAREAVNVDWPVSGKARRRSGYTKVVSGTRCHSLWRGGDFPFALYVDGATLFALTRGGTPFAVRAGMAPREVSYALVNDRVYWSNGQQTGQVLADATAVAWGVESPAGQPAVAASVGVGGLAAGRYQVAVTFRTARGEEGGTGEAVAVDVTEGGGIALSAVPQPVASDVTTIRVYVSPPNGDVLYFARDMPTGMTSATVGAGSRGVPLATQFLEPMPAGRIVRYLGGRLYVAGGVGGALAANELAWSESLRYGLTDLVNNRMPVGQRIDLMEPVGEGGDGAGLFVADHKRTYWFGGSNPANWGSRIAYPHGAVPGTGICAPGNLFGLETTVPVAYWLAANGVACIGLPGGGVVPLREASTVAPSASAGASMLREIGGIRQIVTTLRDTGPQRVATADRAAARVYRNGVEI